MLPSQRSAGARERIDRACPLVPAVGLTLLGVTCNAYARFLPESTSRGVARLTPLLDRPAELVLIDQLARATYRMDVDVDTDLVEDPEVP